jgi:hypothetical protein
MAPVDEIRDKLLVYAQEKERKGTRHKTEATEKRRARDEEWVKERERELRAAEIELNQRRLEERCVDP